MSKKSRINDGVDDLISGASPKSGPRKKPTDGEKKTLISASISRNAYIILQQEKIRRKDEGNTRWSYGDIITDLIMEHIAND